MLRVATDEQKESRVATILRIRALQISDGRYQINTITQCMGGNNV